MDCNTPNSEWCNDELNGGYTHLLAVTHEVVYVHWCGKPAYLVWKKYERYCDECGRSFSGPGEEDLCEDHGGETWPGAWQKSAEIRTFWLTTRPERSTLKK